eukprot:5802153-Alexandrium_andersonii.AAC.1
MIVRQHILALPSPSNTCSPVQSASVHVLTPALRLAHLNTEAWDLQPGRELPLTHQELAEWSSADLG